MENNMKLWDAVCETNPAHTKKVNFGRGFTAIDPMHQIKNATQQFGPAGQGWGWSVRDTKFLPTDQVAILVRLVTHDDCQVEQWGQCSLYIDSKKSKPDGDCMKKATTDGLTKCLSYLGFNADVFLGKFDDNKYVAEMEEKHSEQKKGIHVELSADDVDDPTAWIEERMNNLQKFVVHYKQPTQKSFDNRVAKIQNDPIYSRIDVHQISVFEGLKVTLQEALTKRLKEKETA
jgi:Holliday junction resolvase RusA-like endonuclease